MPQPTARTTHCTCCHMAAGFRRWSLEPYSRGTTWCTVGRCLPGVSRTSTRRGVAPSRALPSAVHGLRPHGAPAHSLAGMEAGDTDLELLRVMRRSTYEHACESALKQNVFEVASKYIKLSLDVNKVRGKGRAGIVAVAFVCVCRRQTWRSLVPRSAFGWT